MADERLLKVRKEIKAKKPTFLRQEAHKISKLKKTWRQPKGCDSKMRRKLGSRRKMPSLGYSSPRKVRGLNKFGLESVKINNIAELQSINPSTQVAVVARVGAKKRVEILKACQEKKITVENFKNIDDYLKKVAEKISAKKQSAKDRKAKKVKKDKSKKEEKKEEKKEQKAPQQETKKGEKSEKIKTLEKRQ